MNVTFCITCCDKDQHFLPGCLEFVQKQTVKPDHILIVASGTNIEQLRLLTLNYPNLDFIVSHNRLSAGMARNMALQSCFTTDIICFCDVDDEIHPQKCQIVKNVFASDKIIDVFVHSYKKTPDRYTGFKPIDELNLYKIDQRSNNYLQGLIGPYEYCGIAHGHACIKKHKIKTRYNNQSYGEDTRFLCDVLDNNYFIAYSDICLINYISKISNTWKPEKLQSVPQ